MSIRLRLSLLYLTVLGITLFSFGAVAYLRLNSSLRSEVDRSLRDRAARDFTPAPARPARSGDTSEPLRPRVFALLANARLGDPNILVQVDDGQQQPAFRSPNLGTDTLPLPKRLNGGGFSTVRLNGVSFRVLEQSLPDDLARSLPGSSPPYTALLARSLVDTENALNRLRVILILGGAGCLALAGVAGWLLARGALRPIGRLTAEARGIGRRQDFSRRIDYHGPDDEVGRLAMTFNEMLDGLAAAHTRLEKALEAQRRFVADASHELRTPLTTIRGNVDLLRLERAGTNADEQEALADIASEAERMSRLVNHMLALARADSGMHINRRPLEIPPIVDEVLQKAQRLADGVGLYRGEIANVRVLADHDYLVQLLFILVDNAFKYTSAGGAVTISSDCVGGELRIAVSDTGIGISPQDQAHVFDRFFRGDPSRHGEGTGLGLAIASWIATELEGRIELQSAPGKGSTFTVVLPALPATAAAPEREPAFAATA